MLFCYFDAQICVYIKKVFKIQRIHGTLGLVTRVVKVTMVCSSRCHPELYLLMSPVPVNQVKLVLVLDFLVHTIVAGSVLFWQIVFIYTLYTTLIYIRFSFFLLKVVYNHVFQGLLFKAVKKLYQFCFPNNNCNLLKLRVVHNPIPAEDSPVSCAPNIVPCNLFSSEQCSSN